MALSFMRRHKRWLYVFLWVVILGFIVFYIPAFDQEADAGSPGETLARVGGERITVGEFQRAYARQRQRMERAYGGRVDAAMLEQLGLREQTLNSLVDQKLLVLEAERLGLRVDGTTLAREIETSPAFQEDGRFMGVAEIRRRLELSGVSVAEFEESLRAQMLAERLEALVSEGVAVTPEEVEQEFRRRGEQVKLEYVQVDASAFRAGLQASDEELRARFEANKEAYRVPEKRVLSYLFLEGAELQNRVALPEAQIEAYYREHADQFKSEEQVCASHILIKTRGADGAGEGHVEDEARKLAQAVLDEVRGGADFPALAKARSEDKGSGPNGGDLSCFSRGRMLPEFDQAAFSLQPGETSELVKTSLGFHVIRINSRRDEQVQPLAAVKEGIRQTLLAQQVRKLLEEKAKAISAGLHRGRSLEELAKEHQLSVSKSPAMDRDGAPAPLDSPALLKRAFELKAGELEHEPFALPRGYAFISLDQIQPTRVPELKDVSDKLRSDVIEQKALEQARARCLELKARAERDGLEKAAGGLGLVRKETPAPAGRGQALGDLGSSRELDQAAFALPEKTLSDPVRVGNGYAVLRVLEKKGFDADAFAKQKAGLAASLRQERKQQLFRAYMEKVRERFPVERRDEAFQRAAG